ncbi:glycosyltransferase [Microbacterium sp. ARD31]|jgi:cellulose synthase/poly-beta-1,6-N-acetylglucosamine synthase-like glycosyltransferase|uniref:glycosyltransferase n=1 Tax=Microbacterium sp. ARD31 TaxID=2962576 RepID=UPI00288212F5|nr:glycosyltransferase [Microbacterium sp. ARD31]MDT0188246.1 glycosyltransferase [Microbacterium sp. ARD31]
MAVASVIIPAHNEAATIGRNLLALRQGTGASDLDVVVVCNGCTDQTAEVARRADPLARVIEIQQPSKAEAVRVGNTATDVFPRVHLDADIELSGTAVMQLLEPITRDHVLATAPRRDVPKASCSRWVRWYYDVWESLPQVESGLFGRGVVVLSEQAQARVAALPRMMSDDLGMSDSFSGDERRVVPGAVAVIHPPRTLRDLVRRRIRIATGNTQAARLGVRRPASRTSTRTLLGLAVSRPGLALRLPVFLGVHVAARLGARRAVRSGDFTTWQRDESSRS